MYKAYICIRHTVSNLLSNIKNNETVIVRALKDSPFKVKMMEKQTRTGLRLLLTIDKIDSVEKALKSLSVFQK